MSENLTGVVMGYKDWHKSVIATLQEYDEKKGEAGAQVRTDKRRSSKSIYKFWCSSYRNLDFTAYDTPR